MSSQRLIPVYAFQPTPTPAPRGARESEDDVGFYLSLALGLIVESARASEAVSAQYDFDVPVLFSEQELLDAVGSRGPGVCLFSSYVWNVDANRAASRAVKELDPRCVTIHGGPSTPKHAEMTAAFLRDHPHVDLAMRGEGEIAIGELLARLAPTFGASSLGRARALGDLPAISFLSESGEVVRTAERSRVDDLGRVPSPYLTGFFDRVLRDRAACGRSQHILMATLETNRGCPYQCTFCDWGSLTLQKIRTFPAARVRAELDWMGRHQIERVFLGDANFGILSRDVEMAVAMADTRRRLGYPRDVSANYTKNGSELLTEVFEIWQAAGISFDPSISIQTTDTATLRVVRRSNIKASKYAELSAIYRDMGVAPRVHLMMGLPGQTLAAWKRDLQFAFDRQEAPHIFPTLMLPNSPMAEPAYVRDHGLRVDERGVVIESTAFTEAEWHEMGRIACAYTVFQSLNVLKFVLMYLQWDHGLRAVDVIHAYVEAAWADAASYPHATRLLGRLLEVRPDELFAATTASFREFHEHGWEALLDEFAHFIERRHGVARDGAFQVALRVQAAVLPREGAPASPILQLDHDFVAYTRLGCDAMLRGECPPARLDTFVAGLLQVVDVGGRAGVFEEMRLEEAQPTLLRSPDAAAGSGAVVAVAAQRTAPGASEMAGHAQALVAALGLGPERTIAERFRLGRITPGRRIEVSLARRDERLTLYLEPPGPAPCYVRTKFFRVLYRTPETGRVPLPVVDAFIRRLVVAEARVPASVIEALFVEPPS